MLHMKIKIKKSSVEIEHVFITLVTTNNKSTSDWRPYYEKRYK